MIYNNITFDGYHCREHMGLIYVPDKPEQVVAPQTVYSYSIAGSPGTTAYGDQQTISEYSLSGTFYPARDIDNEAEAQRLWRNIAQWLGVGRRKLVKDSEPDKYVIAEVQTMDADEYGWIDGGLHVTWLCQPYHWALYPDVLSLTVTDSVSSEWCVETSLPAPVDASIINNGTAAITSATVIVGDKCITFEGLELLPDERLDVTMMTPIGAVITSAEGTTVSAMPMMQVFEQLLATGKVNVRCELEFAATGGSAILQLKAHSCWR